VGKHSTKQKKKRPENYNKIYINTISRPTGVTKGMCHIFVWLCRRFLSVCSRVRVFNVRCRMSDEGEGDAGDRSQFSLSE